METATLAGIIITGVVSLFDLIVNIFQICASGRCQSDCCGCFSFTHTSEDTPVNNTVDLTESKIDAIAERVRSVPSPPKRRPNIVKRITESISSSSASADN